MPSPVKTITKEYKEAFSLFTPNVRNFLMGNFMLGIASNLVQLLLNLYMKSLGLSGAQIGVVLSYRALGSFLIAIPASLIVAMLEPKLVLIGTALLLGASYAAQALFAQYGAIAAAVFFTGVFNSVYQVAAGPFFMRNSGREERTHIFALNGALGMGTGVIGSLFGGVLKDIIFKATQNEVYAYQMTLLTAVCFIIAAIVPFLSIKSQKTPAFSPTVPNETPVPPVPPVPPATPVPNEPAGGKAPDEPQIPLAQNSPSPVLPSPGEQKTPRPWFQRRANTGRRRVPIGKINVGLYAKILVPGFIVGMGAGLTIPYLNLYFKNVFDLPDPVIAVIFSAGQVVTFIGMMSGPLIARRISKERTIFLTQVISVPFILVLTYLHFLPVVIFAFLVRQGLMNMSSPINDNFALEMVPHEQQHLMNALKMLNWTGSWMVSARISGNMIDTVGFAPSFTLTAILYAVSSALFWLFFLRKRGNHVRT